MRVLLAEFVATPLRKQYLIVLFGRVQNSKNPLFWIIDSYTISSLSLIIRGCIALPLAFKSLRILTLKRAICSYGFRSLCSLHPTENSKNPRLGLFPLDNSSTSQKTILNCFLRQSAQKSCRIFPLRRVLSHARFTYGKIRNNKGGTVMFRP